MVELARDPGPGSSRPRILFFAEAVTLAHAARPVVLAGGLDAQRYDVCLAWHPRYAQLFPELTCRQRPIHSIPSRQFLDALAAGQPVFSTQTLMDYVAEDRQVIDEFKPDVVVGDFRLSLAVSARLAKVPYIAISNAYWSPHAEKTFPMPELPFLRFTGVALGSLVFRMLSPLILPLHCRPLNRVCRQYRVAPPGFNLRRVFTEADYVVYSDVPELVRTSGAPPNHRYIGPILWSPEVELPDWWDALPADRALIYVTFGSSGASELLPAVIRAAAGLPVVMAIATAGRYSASQRPANVFLADYLPGHVVAARASLVICNGGSPTTYQALAAGTPTLGLASNLDQYLNMRGVERSGAGQLLRAGMASTARLRGTMTQLLESVSHRHRAKQIARAMAMWHPAEQFRSLIEEIVARRHLPAQDHPHRAVAAPPVSH